MGKAIALGKAPEDLLVGGRREDPPGGPSFRVDQDHRRGKDVHLRVLGEEGPLPFQPVGSHPVVSVQDGDPGGIQGLESQVPSGGPAHSFRPEDPDPGVTENRKDLGRIIGGTVVHDDHLPVPEGLGKDGLHRLPHEGGPIPDRHDHAHPGQACNLPPFVPSRPLSTPWSRRLTLFGTPGERLQHPQRHKEHFEIPPTPLTSGMLRPFGPHIPAGRG